MKKFKQTDVRIRHKKTKLWLCVEHLGARAENDTYATEESEASVFASKEGAVDVAKRLGLRKLDFEIA